MKNILLYLSAFMPMYILIIIKQILELVFGNTDFTFLTIVVFCFLGLAIILGYVGLHLEIINKKQQSEKIIIVSKENLTDQHFLGYFSLFVLFAITFDLSKTSMFVIFVLILVMIGIVYVKNKLFYINPFLNVLGFNFYNITYKLVGKKDTLSTKIFFRGDLLTNKEYEVKIKDENFAFVVNMNKKIKPKSTL